MSWRFEPEKISAARASVRRTEPFDLPGGRHSAQVDGVPVASEEIVPGDAQRVTARGQRSEGAVAIPYREGRACAPVCIGYRSKLRSIHLDIVKVIPAHALDCRIVKRKTDPAQKIDAVLEAV